MTVESKPATLNLRNQKDSSIGRVMDEYKKSDAADAAKPSSTTAGALGGAGKPVASSSSDAIDDKLSKL